MKVTALLGSPRKRGNSSGLTAALTDILKRKGYVIQTHHLNSLTYRGCQACEGCKGRSEFCVLLDDLTPVLDDVKNSDVVILASPVYWGDVSAQMKAFIDRTYSFLTPEFITGPVRHRFAPGKKLVFVLSQGGDQALYDDIFPRYNSFFEELELFKETYLLRGCDLSDRNDHSNNQDLLEQVESIAAAL